MVAYALLAAATQRDAAVGALGVGDKGRRGATRYDGEHLLGRVACRAFGSRVGFVAGGNLFHFFLRDVDVVEVSREDEREDVTKHRRFSYYVQFSSFGESQFFLQHFETLLKALAKRFGGLGE